MESLANYVRKFSKLRVAKIEGFPAPHKPILLLSIIESIEAQEIKCNRIAITPELVARFKDLWYTLVHQDTFTANFSLPFYHLKSDGFWHLQTLPGRELLLTSSNSIKSFSHLKQVVDFAFFDEALYELLCQNGSRKLLQAAMMQTYFPNEQLESRNSIISEITDQILNEPATSYKLKAANFDEEEIYVRGGVFKKTIPKIYNYTCAVSGMRIIAENEVQMIDACHIVPFAESRDDTIRNGLSLCPNIHRAFDRGLLSLNDDFTVLVQSFVENDNAYAIKQFEGKRILLPSNHDYVPSLENLAKHRQRHHFN